MQFTDFRERPLLFVDLEMSGLDVTRHEILEMGALVVDPKTFEITKEYETKIKPDHIETADPEALKINGYNEKDWANAKTLPAALEEFNSLAPGAMMVGWNLALDFAFLVEAFKKTGLKRSFDYHAIDILSLAWASALKDEPTKQVREIKLSEFCKKFAIKREEKHRAMADIRATYEVFRKLISAKPSETTR